MKKKRSVRTHSEKRKYIADRAKKLWDIVRDERRQQLNCEDRPFRQAFEEAWSYLEPLHAGAMKRDDDEFTARTPMDALPFYAEGCMYPPPEIMLAVYKCYEDYLHAGGEMTLEEAFFGPSKPKSGNRAQQYSTRNRYWHWARRIRELEREGHTRTRAAELVSEELNGAYEPETVLRLANKHDPMRGWERKRESEKRIKQPTK